MLPGRTLLPLGCKTGHGRARKDCHFLISFFCLWPYLFRICFSFLSFPLSLFSFFFFLFSFLFSSFLSPFFFSLPFPVLIVIPCSVLRPRGSNVPRLSCLSLQPPQLSQPSAASAVSSFCLLLITYVYRYLIWLCLRAVIFFAKSFI